MWYFTWNKCEQSWRMKKESKKKTIEIECEKTIMKKKRKRHELKMSVLNGDHEIHYWSKGDLVKRMDNLELNLTILKLKIKKRRKKDHVCITWRRTKYQISGNPKTSCFRPIHHNQLLKKSLNPLIWWNIISLHFCKRKW